MGRRPAGVHSFLDASTGHLTRDDDRMLARWASADGKEGAPLPPYRTIGHAYGYFVHVRLDGDDGREEAEQAARSEHGASEAFFALQAHARRNGCWWINLDRDADSLPGLPTHGW